MTNIKRLADWIRAKAYTSSAWVPARSPGTRLCIAIASVVIPYTCIGTAFLYWIDYDNFRRLEMYKAAELESSAAKNDNVHHDAA